MNPARLFSGVETPGYDRAPSGRLNDFGTTCAQLASKMRQSDIRGAIYNMPNFHQRDSLSAALLVLVPAAAGAGLVTADVRHALMEWSAEAVIGRWQNLL